MRFNRTNRLLSQFLSASRRVFRRFLRRPGPPLVFVHVPKTGGTSFRKAAETACWICYDYGPDGDETTPFLHSTIFVNDTELFMRRFRSADYDMLCGHFHVGKYRELFGDDARYCAFLRDPVQRLVSEHRHLTRDFGYTASLWQLCTERANFQSRVLAGMDLEDFYFIGLTERYADSVRMFNAQSGLNLPVLTLNTQRQESGERWSLADAELQQLTEHNQQDIALYERARALFDERLAAFRTGGARP